MGKEGSIYRRTRPMGEDGTPWHHLPNGRFRNPKGSPKRNPRPKNSLRFIPKMLRQAFEPVDIPEGHVLPRDQAARDLEQHYSLGDALTWLGHAAFLVRMAGKTIITDPYLTAVAGPAGVGPKRYVKSGIAIKDLPQIDILIVSHNHYDHLDDKAIRALPNKDKIHAIVPLRLGNFFRERGYTHVTELDWDESWSGDGLTITALPVVHWSRRGRKDYNETLWAGFAVKSASHHLFFGGDSGYGEVFADIGEEYGPFDTAILGIGAYEPREMMKASHATPEEAVQMGRDLGAKSVVGMHWGTVLLTAEPPFEPPVRFLAAGKDQGYAEEDLWVMKIGETRALTRDKQGN